MLKLVEKGWSRDDAYALVFLLSVDLTIVLLILSACSRNFSRQLSDRSD